MTFSPRSRISGTISAEASLGVARNTTSAFDAARPSSVNGSATRSGIDGDTGARPEDEKSAASSTCGCRARMAASSAPA
jgi:hypothetical protein